jgi:hypothetical protein
VSSNDDEPTSIESERTVKLTWLAAGRSKSIDSRPVKTWNSPWVRGKPTASTTKPMCVRAGSMRQAPRSVAALASRSANAAAPAKQPR